jgi:sugar phosphate isomerase/epimerase
MELGANTYSLHAFPRPMALGLLGLREVELWAGHAPWTPRATRARDVLRDAAHAGVRLRAYCVGGLFGLPLGTVRERAARACALAVDLGVDLVTVIADRAAVPVLDDLASRTGVRIALENHWYTELAEPSDMLAALEGCSPAVGLAIDTGHFAFLGRDLASVAHELGPRALHVHLKVVRAPGRLERYARRVRREFRLKCTTPGPDDRLDRFLTALRATGYDGLLAVEHEVDGDPTAALAAYCQRVDPMLARLDPRWWIPAEAAAHA